MRLIDADSLGNEFDEQMYYLQWEVDSVANPHRFQRAEGINWCRNTLNNAPTVDVVPVVHASWSDGLVCSECKCGIMEYCYEEPISEFPYCPFCGARMDGAE